MGSSDLVEKLQSRVIHEFSALVCPENGVKW
jgi:hypothetical protein